VQIGIRLVLPLVALAEVGLAAATTRACRAAGGRSLLAGARMLLPGAGLVWSAAAAITVWPHGLCYVNELWGGTERGYLVVSDSNYDWGQGLKELAHWQVRHGDAPLDVWYFGTDPALRRLPVRALSFHALPLHRAEEIRALVQGHYLAVGTTLVHGSLGTMLRADTPGWDSYWQALALLREHPPADRTTTFLMYDFTGRGQKAARAASP
jgi:hypothetical protein